MVTAVLYFDTSDPDGFIEALGTTGHLFEGVDSFHGFSLKRGIEDPNRFLMTVEWDSVDDHKAWQKENAEDFLGALGDYVSGRPDITHFE